MIGAAVTHRAIWMTAFAHLWQAGLVIGLLWALERWLLRRAPARYQSALWWLALLHLALPAPLLLRAAGGWLPAWGGAVGEGGATIATRLRTVLRPDALAVAGEGGAGASALWPVLSLLWAAGTLAVAWALWRHGSREAAAAGTVAEPAEGKRLAAAARLAAVDPGRIRLVDADCLPRAAGVLRPRILLPPALVTALSVQELAAILAHEDAHCRRRDGLARLLCLPIFLTLWFFPPTWLVLRRLRRAAELACDEAVLRAGFRPELYARALARTMRLALALPVTTPALAGSGADIRLRLGRLRRGAGESTSMKRNITVLMTALFLVGASMSTAAIVQDAVEPPALEGRGASLERALLEMFPGAARQVDVEMRDVPLVRILGSLATTGGFDLDVAGIRGRLGSLEAHGTVASALVVLASAHDLILGFDPPRDRLVVRPAERPGPPAASPAPYRVGGDVQAPERMEYVPPVYPESARRARLQGVVILEVRISRDGDVEEVHVLRGLGLGLDEAAKAAVQQWRYRPTVYQGRRIPILLTVTVQFQLAAGAGDARPDPGAERRSPRRVHRIGGEGVVAPEIVRVVDPRPTRSVKASRAIHGSRPSWTPPGGPLSRDSSAGSLTTR